MPDKFYFFSKSADKQPGKGIHEEVSNPNDYKDLARVKEWRKILSNFWMQPFTLDGYTWNSVEHFYQGNKFKTTNEKFLRQFTVESNSEISKDPTMGKAAGGKTGTYQKKSIRPSYVKGDKKYIDGKPGRDAMLRALAAKFTQNPDLGRVLLATGNAELWHGTRGVKPHREYPIERVRECIRKYPDFIYK